jgi:hypothetical protein
MNAPSWNECELNLRIFWLIIKKYFEITKFKMNNPRKEEEEK